MSIRLGLQTITWGDPQDENMGDILDVAKVCGYEGVEIGWRRIAPIGVDKLGTMLTERGLCLAASHAGGNLMDTDQADSTPALPNEQACAAPTRSMRVTSKPLASR